MSRGLNRGHISVSLPGYGVMHLVHMQLRVGGGDRIEAVFAYACCLNAVISIVPCISKHFA